MSVSAGIRRFFRLSFWASLLLSRFFSPGFRKKECFFISLIFPPDNQAMAAAYRTHVRRQGGMDSILLPLGHGIEITCWNDAAKAGIST